MKNKPLYLTVALLGGLALTLALVLLVGQAVPVRADPDVLYVAPGGNCNGASPCYENVQAAVDSAASGDEIRVAAGTYTDMHTIHALQTAEFTATQLVAITKSLTIGGGYTTTNWLDSDPETNRTVLDAHGTGRVVVVIGSEVYLTGLEVVNGSAVGLGGEGGPFGSQDAGGGIYISDAVLRVENCMLHSNSASHHGGGIHFTDASQGVIVNSHIYSNTQGGALQGGNRAGGGIYVNHSSQVTIRDSIITLILYKIPYVLFCKCKIAGVLFW